MLAERLYEFAKALKLDYEKTKVVSLLKAFALNLQNQAGSPTTQQYQTAVSESRAALEKALRSSETRTYPPYWRHLLKECALDGYVGEGLLAKVQGVLSKNNATLPQAATEVQALADSVETSLSRIHGLIAGLDWFEIEPTLLRPGTFEIDISIPRPAIDNELGELGAEFVKLDRIVAFFNELTTGSRDGAKLIGIASSDPSSFLEAFAPTAAAFTLALERAVALYGKILEIRKAHSDLKKAGVPDDALEGLKSHVEVAIKDGLEEQAKLFEEKYLERLEKGRRQELSTELRFVLGQLAERVDDGYRFDVRGAPPTKDDPRAEEIAAALEVVRKHRPSLLAYEHTGAPVLRLADRKAENKQNG